VINQDSDHYIKSPEEWISIPGSPEAIAAFSRAGYLVTLATNQSGLGRGLFSEIDLANMHQKMCQSVEVLGGKIDGIFFCPHLPSDGCGCRKPKTGLLEAISQEFDLSLVGVPFIGDSLKDIEAARHVKAQPILVRTGKGLVTEQTASADALKGVLVFDDLSCAADFLLGQSA
jgi:D-glycero-D-manno-heptose 1,7-bisphosphate phosphatase